MTGDCPSTDIVLQSIDSHSDGYRDSECLEYTLLPYFDDLGKYKFVLRRILRAPCRHSALCPLPLEYFASCEAGNPHPRYDWISIQVPLA